jgi:type II secretory pathway pseudopilin PulG
MIDRDKRKWQQRRFGFSLIEMALGVLIVSIVIGIVMTIYSRSNKYAAKGAWRVNTISRQRLCLRQVKDFLERSSYPSVIQANNYLEASPGFGSDAYCLQLTRGTPMANTSSTNQFFSYTVPGEVLRFYSCTPRQELEGLAAVVSVIPGQASRYVISLEAGATADSAMRLVATSAAADVTLSGSDVQVGTFGAETSISLLDDVSLLSVGVSPESSSEEKTVVEFEVETADPFDGRLKVHEKAKAVVNVRIKS